MIKFFRKIRQRLVIEKKFSKYILYALGEIFLIVIGILIAVKIGSWKSEKENGLVLKRSLIELNEEVIQMIWRAKSVKESISLVSRKVDSIKNRQMSTRQLAENFMIITTNVNFPTTLSNYEQVTQNLSRQSTSYEILELSRFLNSLNNSDLVFLKKSMDNLELNTNNTLNEWSKERWFEYRYIPDSIINYQDDFLNHYSYRNKLDLYSEVAVDFESRFNVVYRNLLSLKIFTEKSIREAKIDDFPQILEKNGFYPQALTSCNNEEPIKIQEINGLGWSHTVICNLSNEDIIINEKEMDHGNVVVNKHKLSKDTYVLTFFGFGNILEFKYPNGKCKSVVITESMSSIILN